MTLPTAGSSSTTRTVAVGAGMGRTSVVDDSTESKRGADGRARGSGGKVCRKLHRCARPCTEVLDLSQGLLEARTVLTRSGTGTGTGTGTNGTLRRCA